MLRLAVAIGYLMTCAAQIRFFLEGTDMRLTIEHLIGKDNGVYPCHACNRGGSHDSGLQTETSSSESCPSKTTTEPGTIESSDSCGRPKIQQVSDLEYLGVVLDELSYTYTLGQTLKGISESSRLETTTKQSTTETSWSSSIETIVSGTTGTTESGSTETSYGVSESTSNSTKIIYQSMHGNDQALESATGIPDLTSNVSRNIPDMPNFSNLTETISEKKCTEYVNEMLKRQENKNSEYSGSQDASIENGKVVHEAEFPHMGALVYWSWARNGQAELVFLCAASLISDSFMLTAAHCEHNLVRPQPHLVRLGSRHRVNSTYELARKYIKIRNFICHPTYDLRTEHFNIALVELNEKVVFTKYIQPACLPSGRSYGGSGEATATELIATGWESVGARINGYAMSNELRSVKVHVIDRILCDDLLKRYEYWTGLQPHQMCAGEVDGSADTYLGYSGSPLQYLLVNTTSEGNIYTLMSVTSHGMSRHTPWIYTDISYYSIITWIESIVWPGEQK